MPEYRAYSAGKGAAKGAVEGGSAVVVLTGLIGLLNALGADIDVEVSAALVTASGGRLALWRFLRNFVKQAREGRV